MNECLGPDKGILRKNINEPLWSALTQGVATFKTTVPYAAGQAWAQAFVECRRAPKKVPAPPYHGVAKFPQQLYCSSSDRDGVVGSGNGGGSEEVLLSSYQATLGQ